MKKQILSIILLSSASSYAMEVTKQNNPQQKNQNNRRPHYPDISQNLQQSRNEHQPNLVQPQQPAPLHNIQPPVVQLHDNAPAQTSLVARGCNALINILTKIKNKSAQNQPNNTRAQLSNAPWISTKDLISLGLNLYTIKQTTQFNSGAGNIPTLAPKLFGWFGTVDANKKTTHTPSCSCFNFHNCSHPYKTAPTGTYSLNASGNNNFKSLINTYSYLPLLATTVLHGINWYQNWQYRQLKNKHALAQHTYKKPNKAHALALKQTHDTMIGYPALIQRINNAGALLSTVLLGLLKYNKIDHPQFFTVLGLQAASYWFNSYMMYTDSNQYQQEARELNNRFSIVNED